MGRREEREEIQSTWMVMREPKDRDGTRRERRTRLAKLRSARTTTDLARTLIPDGPLSVRADESGGVPRSSVPRDSSVPTGTFMLADRDSLKNFELGQKRSIADMAPDEAIAVFGRPVYDAWKLAGRRSTWGTATITSIDREAGTITYTGDV